MTDIDALLKRLRHPDFPAHDSTQSVAVRKAMLVFHFGWDMRCAADEIERLHTEIERREFASDVDIYTWNNPDALAEMRQRLRLKPILQRLRERRDFCHPKSPDTDMLTDAIAAIETATRDGDEAATRDGDEIRRLRTENGRLRKLMALLHGDDPEIMIRFLEAQKKIEDMWRSIPLSKPPEGSK